MKKNNAEMRALKELREVIDSMLNEEFDSTRKPALMALKVSKTEMPLAKVDMEDMASEMPEMEEEEVSPEMPADMEESSEEDESPKVEIEIESEGMKKGPCKCGKPDCDCASEEMPEEEDSDAVKKLRSLLIK